MSERYRIEHDSQGELRVPAQALYGAVRALDKKAISGFSVNHEQLARVLRSCLSMTDITRL